MSRVSRALIFGILTGLVGAGLTVFPLWLDVEENVGLDFLFMLRGTRQAPAEVVVIGLDKASAEKLNLPDDLRKWPRSYHARLIENLSKAGASVIAFDMSFEEPRPEEDPLFSEAMKRYQNVVLCSRLRMEDISLTDKTVLSAEGLKTTRMVPCAPALAQTAVAWAPFPLPKVPVKVSQFWTFASGAGETPTLPIVAFQVFALETYEEFFRLIEQVNPKEAERLPLSRKVIISERNIGEVIRTVRNMIKGEPLVALRMLEALKSQTPPMKPRKREMIKSLIQMYQNPDSQYLDFYGPPRTIPTIPYHQVLGEEMGGKFDFRGKAVFVGHSELIPSEQKERFYTVFSQSNGLDISGVEIAAIAFANLVENRSVQPLSIGAQMAVVFLLGISIGLLFHLLPFMISVLCVAGLNILYLAFAFYQFKDAGVWYPVLLLFFVQTPLGFIGTVVWRYVNSNKERQNIKKALGYYLPDRVVGQLAKDIASLGTSSQLVYGICLHTDAAKYTSLSESMDPQELRLFMNKYYENIFKPVREHGGTVSNVIADSMMALWVSPHPDVHLRNKACLAALDVARAIERFNRDAHASLSTRIGIHSGHIILGDLGALDHYEYRPVGDIVNTASRIEELNKYLGTQILASEGVISQINGLPTRNLGRFLLVGKSKSITVFELIGPWGEADERLKAGYSVFAQALDAFQTRSWDKAIEKFHGCIEHLGSDGPSEYYLSLCRSYKENAPGPSWDGEVSMTAK